MKVQVPTHKQMTDESRQAAMLQPEFYIKLREMALSEEFQIGLKMAVQSSRARNPIGSEINHLHNHALIANLAITDLVETIYDTFINPPYVQVQSQHSHSDFSED